MSLNQKLFFCLGVFLGILLGQYFVKQKGGWGLLPTLVIGFGLVLVYIFAGIKFLDRRRR